MWRLKSCSSCSLYSTIGRRNVLSETSSKRAASSYVNFYSCHPLYASLKRIIKSSCDNSRNLFIFFCTHKLTYFRTFRKILLLLCRRFKSEVQQFFVIILNDID